MMSLKVLKNIFNEVDFSGFFTIKNFLVICLLAALYISFEVYIWKSYETEKSQRIEILLDQEKHKIDLFTDQVKNFLSENINEVLLIEDIFHNHENISYSDSIANTKSLMVKRMELNRTIDQIRLLNSEGSEIYRLNGTSNDGSVTETLKSNLQNKSHKDYFMKSQALQYKSILIGPLDLNTEYRKVEQNPIKPTMRFTLPINIDSRYDYLLVLNVMPKKLLSVVKSLDNNGNLMLLNKEGYWLYNHMPEKNWGFMFYEKNDVSFANENENVWSKRELYAGRWIETENGIFNLHKLSFSELSESLTKNLLVNENVNNYLKNVNSSNVWWFVNYISADTLNNKIYPLKNRYYFLSALLTLLVIILYIAFYLLTIKRYVLFDSDSVLRASLSEGVNRNAFYKMKEELTREGKSFVLALISINNFGKYSKDSNNSQILKKMYIVLKKGIRSTDYIINLGNGEFAIYYVNTNSHAELHTVIERLRSNIATLSNDENEEQIITASIATAMSSDEESLIDICSKIQQIESLNQ